MFPTRIMQEQVRAILLEDSNEFMTNRAQTYLGEESINGTEKGVSKVLLISYSS